VAIAVYPAYGGKTLQRTVVSEYSILQCATVYSNRRLRQSVGLRNHTDQVVHTYVMTSKCTSDIPRVLRHLYVWLESCMYVWLASRPTTHIGMTCIEPYNICMYDLYYVYTYVICFEPYDIYMYKPYDIYMYNLHAQNPTTCICMTRTLRDLQHIYVWLAFVIHIYVMKSPPDSPETPFGATTGSWIFVTLWRHVLHWICVIQCAMVIEYHSVLIETTREKKSPVVLGKNIRRFFDSTCTNNQ